MSSSDSQLDRDMVLAEAFRVAFPSHGPRRMESYSAQRVFELYFQEWRHLKDENLGLRKERDEYRDRMDQLLEEVATLKAQLADIPKK